ncbi:hypothetical protein [Halobacteriovorax marinus]|uniref:hypothetical protein n=1 Tax=Halobacteriovorax marinus TaxID=97084 RepID=UPI003A94E9E3
MTPLLKVGKAYPVTPVSPSELRRFDVILFWQNNRPNAHFYWGKHKIGNIKGTMAKSLKHPKDFDSPIPDDQILGRVNVKTSLFIKFIFTIRYLFSKT